MYCKYCGKRIMESHKFCAYCGNKVVESTQYEINNEHTVAEQYTNVDSNNNKRKGSKGVKVVCGIILLIVGAIVSFFVIAAVDGIIEAIKEEPLNNNTDIQTYSESQNDNNGDDEGSDDIIDGNKSDIDTVPLLTFLLSFNDSKMSTDATDWNDFIYGNGYYDTGSVDDYYMECSKGKFTFVPAKESNGIENDGIIEATVNINHPCFNFTREEDDYYTEGFEFFENVLNATDEYIDFKEYDINKDGYIVPEELTIVFVFSGYEIYEEFDSDFTTYSCSLIYDEYFAIDDILIDECIYTAEKDPYNERDNQMVGIGVLCHELGHALDLPDLYDTDYSSQGLAFHCLMAAGVDNSYRYDPYGTSPAPLIAWEREFLGFEDPQVITNNGTYSVYARSTDDYNILKIEDGRGYYLIENVDYQGFGKGLDMYLKRPGIAIWYVNSSIASNQSRFDDNTVNTNEKKYGVTLIEANDTKDMLDKDFDYQGVYDHYHYLKGDNAFTSASGIIIEILDNPGDEMRVKITLP